MDVGIVKRGSWIGRPRGAASMPCPRCTGVTRVLSTTRTVGQGGTCEGKVTFEEDVIVRYRVCAECGGRIKTAETIIRELAE